MPVKIPLIEANEPMRISPVTATTRGAGRVGEAISGAGRVGEAISGLGATVLDIETKITQRKKEISDTIFLAELETDMQVEHENIVSKLQKTPNPETYYSDWEKQFGDAAEQRLKQIKNPGLRTKAQVTLQRMKKGEVTEQKHYGNILFINTMQARTERLLDSYAKNEDLEKGLLLIEDQALKGIYAPDVGEKMKQAFQQKVEVKKAENADVAADEAIRENPILAEKMLQDKNFLPNLKPMQRQDKIEKAKAATKVWEAEKEKKQKEAEKLIHDNEEREIGNQYMAGDLKGAFTLAQSSKVLTGDEKKTWADAIKQKSEQREPIDPNVRAAEIVMINDLFTKKTDPKVIRNSILFTPRLLDQDKEQYITKLETKISSEVSEGRRLGYQDIQHIIIPPRVGLSITNLVQSPKATTAIMNAQMALDVWIDQEMKAGKYHSVNEIRIMAQRLAESYAPSIAESMMDIETQAREQAEAIKKLAEERSKKK